MSVTDAFTRQYESLNPRQREAVDAIEGPVMVIAGPGTGKTKILTLRIANILATTDTPAEAILALTFTESGAAEMKRRLADMIGTDAYRVTTATFHGFCNSIIQSYPEAFGALAGAASITDADQAVLITELLEHTQGIELLRPVNAPDLYLKAIITSLNTLKREGIAPDRFETIARAEEQAILNADDLYHEKGAYKGKMKGAYTDQLKQVAKWMELARVYAAYQQLLRERRLYDYNDMVLEAARALETNEELRLMLQEQYQYVLVDEHQDTNNAQNRVIESLASFWETPNLFVVGDAKQAIYRFQGASLENFLYFKEKYPTVRLIELEHNYRSSQLILNAAQGIRASAGEGLQAQSNHPDAPIAVYPLSSRDAQYWMVASQIHDQLQQGASPRGIAVLTRNNADARAVAQFLERQQIPFVLSSEQDALTDPHLHQLFLLLAAVRQFGDAVALYPALHAPVLAIEPLDVYKLAGFCRGGRNPYDVMRSPALMHEAGIDDPDRLQQLAASLAAWSRSIQQPTALESFEQLVHESGLLTAILALPTAPDTLAKLHALYDMLRSHVQRNRGLTLAQFDAHLDFLRERGIAVSAKTNALAPDRVSIMTTHKSKGLEFDTVYLVDCTDDTWGPQVRRQLIRLPQAVFLKSGATVAAENDDEARNLFYVALTRARHAVVISYSVTDTDGTECIPVRYLADIAPTLLAYPDTAPEEMAWQSNGAVRFTPPPPRTPLVSDRAFLNELFKARPFSVTALNNYLACPWRYFYTNLLRIPEAPAFALMYGNAIDRALQEYFDQFKEGTRGTRAELIALFEQFIHHQPLQQVALDAALARGRAALGAYYDQYHATWHTNIINQLAIPAVALKDDILLTGKIDKVELLDASGTVIVIDYKSGKPKSRGEIMGTTKESDGNYLRQLAFYNLLLNRWQDGKYRMTKGVIDFVEPDMRGKLHREEFVITPAQVSELEMQIHTVVDEILNLAFWDRHCDDRACEYCKLRSILQ